MNKPLMMIIAVLIILIGFFGYRHYQDNKFKEDFRKSIQSVPEKMRTSNTILPPQMAKFIKLDILVNYPNIVYYIDVKEFKEKTLPSDAKAVFNQDEGMVCKSFFSAIQNLMISGSKHEQKLFLELIKTENIRADLKLRNAFGENLYTESAILAQCPEYTNAIYTMNNN
ncbi:MAG: hypothetical protein E6Q25_06290 [Acinetobacter sp.]|jgi:predicted negative regulator of RcsB-dependent stress response|nr:MAG: hypothetical protein E6Q25_06290 [Acinetobacter sp.]